MHDELVQPLSYLQLLAEHGRRRPGLPKELVAEHYLIFGSDIFPVI